MRSRSAATFLLGTGLKNVYNMEGGIRAWKGMVAHGLPEAGMAYFSPAANGEEIVGLAWALEEGSKLFYQGVSEHFSDDPETQKMFGWLVTAEQNHEKHLLETYETLTGAQPDFIKLRAKFTDCLKVHRIQKVCQCLIYLNTNKNAIKMKNHRKNNNTDHFIKGGEKVFFSACVLLACALGGSIVLLIAAVIAEL